MHDIIGLMSRTIANASWVTLYDTNAMAALIADSSCLPPQVLCQGIWLSPWNGGSVVSARPNADMPTRL